MHSGCNEDDVPEWSEILAEEGYDFDYVDACESPYAKEWLATEYPEVTEIYTIHYPLPDGGKLPYPT